MSRSWIAVAFLALPVVGCGGEEAPTARELAATALVEAQAGEELSCRDNGAVNAARAPGHPIGYSCYNARGEFYNAVISADGVVTSVSGPVRLRPADE